MFINAVCVVILLLYIADLFVIVPLYTRKKYDHSSRKNKLIVKGIAISVPLFVLLIGCIYSAIFLWRDLFLCLMTIGMALCAIGDIILEIRFFRGGVFFLLGHVVYVLGMFSLFHYVPVSTVIAFLVMLIAGSIFTVKKLDKKYRVPLLLYNLVISASFAMGGTFVRTLYTPFVFVGVGVMFLVASDWMLAANKLYGSNFKRSLVSLIFYFGGQILISSWVPLSTFLCY